MSESSALARVEPWLAPITDAKPAGEDARYDDLHQKIRTEAARIDSPAAGTTDWQVLVQDADVLLTTKAKDLLIESYAAFGLFQNEGLMGLASGLYLIAESLDRYWDDMFPPARRIRARVNAVAWLTDKLNATLGEVQVEASDHDAVEALEAAVKRLQTVVSAKFEDQAPAIRPISDTVQRLKLSLPAASADAPESDTDPPPPPAPPLASPGSAEGPTPPADVAGAPPASPDDGLSSPDDGLSKESLEARLTAGAERWLEPCPGESPAGVSAKHEERYAELRNEITAIDTPLGGEVSWPDVIDRAGGILMETSKDFLMASYLAFGLWETRQFEGLAVGLEVIRGLCDRYWEDSFPPVRRIRGRANALAWLLDRLESRLVDLKLTSDDKDDVEMLEIAVKRFTGKVRERFEDAAPSLRPLSDRLERLKLSLPAKAPPPAPPSPPSEPASGQSAASAAPPAPASPRSAAPVELPKASAKLGALTDPNAIREFAKATSAALVEAAKAIREASIQDPWSYRLVRLGLAMRHPNVAVKGYQSMVRAPSVGLIQSLDQALSAGDWEALVATSEDAVARAPLWLDPHRFSAVALSKLGEDWEPARRAVLAGTAYLILRAPDHLDYLFVGGKPFASDVTKEWIQDEILGTQGGGGGAGGEGAEVLSSARGLAAAGKVDEAMAALSELAHGARGGRARFRAKLAMAQLISANTPSAAEGIYAALAGELESNGLEQWDPEVALDCYRSHLTCLRAMKTPDAKARAATAFRRLCRVDPLGAAKFG